jgi:hypothetical protein
MIAQGQDVTITEIGEEACSFLGVSSGALVVVIREVADHLQPHAGDSIVAAAA